MTDNTTEFDLVVIGSGNGGYIPAIRASQLGMRVALVERSEHLGGTCLNLGCIPTKALLETAARLHEARTGDDFGVKAGQVKLDMTFEPQRTGQISARWHEHDSAALPAAHVNRSLKRLGIERRSVSPRAQFFHIERRDNFARLRAAARAGCADQNGRRND